MKGVKVGLILDESEEAPAVLVRAEGRVVLPKVTPAILRGLNKEKEKLLEFLMQQRNLN